MRMNRLKYYDESIDELCKQNDTKAAALLSAMRCLKIGLITVPALILMMI